MTDEDVPTRPESRNPYSRWEDNFIQQMARRREARKMTQTDLARDLRAYGLAFHQQTVQRIEAGIRPVRLNEAHLIAQALGTSVDAMQAVLAPATRDLVYDVDALRRGAAEAGDQVLDKLHSWLELVDALVLRVSDRLTADQQGDEGITGTTAWGVAWAVRAQTASDQLFQAWNDLQTIVYNRESNRGLEHWSVNAIRNWVEEYHASYSAMFGDEDRISDLPATEAAADL